MAWFARSIANSLKLNEDDEDDEKQRVVDESGPSQSPSLSASEPQSPRGVKEDISELTKTLRSQFWGVASFLSPPSTSPDLQEINQAPDHSDEGDDEEDLIAGIRNDFAEIGGRFKTGISKLSGNLPVSEFTKIASNFLQLGSDGVDPEDYDVGDAIGVNEELVAFVKDLAMHPETWLDFPLPDDDYSFDDFELSDAQYEHAMAVERLAPSLASLRIELCPEYMNENCFWRIYFVLLHPKLNKDDALLLSTPQVLEARAMLSHELQKRNKLPLEAESSEANAAVVEPLDVPSNPSAKESSEFETEKHPIESKEIQVVDKSVIEERNTSTASSSRFVYAQVEDEERDDTDDWLNEEETSESVSAMEGRETTKHPLGEDEEDVSFSDLEEGDDGDVAVSYKKVTNSDSPEWVQLKDSKTSQVKERESSSNEWVDVDGSDMSDI
uniref:BSD domain-containing protein n=1 Tax=Noccaea caerulescens TaxID=107243 RepID=A0A1J3H258_NOCCA